MAVFYPLDTLRSRIQGNLFILLFSVNFKVVCKLDLSRYLYNVSTYYKINQRGALNFNVPTASYLLYSYP